jgi:ABC-type bacteriocin/lantibiotic exporter with double-glycine peptidase domain
MIAKPFPHEYQMDAKDCGPACLKIIAKYYGKYYSLQYLRDLCGITREGVSLLDISYASDKIGLRTISVKVTILQGKLVYAEFVTDNDSLGNNLTHSVVVTSINNIAETIIPAFCYYLTVFRFNV